MKVYYAHPISIYNTLHEFNDIQLLNDMSMIVLNPNSKFHTAKYKEHGMQYFLGLVHGCDCLAFRSFPSGGIGAGVAKEIEEAVKAGLPVFELPSNIYERTMSVDQTRSLIHELMLAPAEVDPTKHVLWEDGDIDIPDEIVDSNGQVVLGLCKNCGRAECELEEPCNVPRHYD